MDRDYKVRDFAKVEYMNRNKDIVACRLCDNAKINSDLLPNEDFSSRDMGLNLPGHRIMLSSGAGLPLRIESEEWNGDSWHMVGKYYPKYCPECGRKIVEYPH